MKRYLNISLSCLTAGLLATTGVWAQNPPTTAKPMSQDKTAKPAPSTSKPAPAEPRTMKPSQQSMGGTSTPANLGAVRIPRAVKADGQALAAGTYQIRVTQTEAQPPAPGQTPQYERWAEFLQGGQLKGREVVTVVPGSDISQVAEARPPASGGQRVEVLKGGDYLRLWLNRGGTHYLIHFGI